MARHRLAGSPAHPGWLPPRVAMSLAAVLAVGIIGAVLLPGPARDARPGGVPAPSWSAIDTAYVQAMLWHHQQAQELASLVQGRTTRPELLRLAASIRTARSSSVAQMTAWLDACGCAAADDLVPPATKPASRWFSGMMARTQLRALAASNGQRFDFLFVDMLVEHHKGAIVMADRVLADGRDAEVAQLAGRTVTYSQRAIRQLSSWRRRWAEPFLRELSLPATQAMPASP